MGVRTVWSTAFHNALKAKKPIFLSLQQNTGLQNLPCTLSVLLSELWQVMICISSVLSLWQFSKRRQYQSNLEWAVTSDNCLGGTKYILFYTTDINTCFNEEVIHNDSIIDLLRSNRSAICCLVLQMVSNLFLLFFKSMHINNRCWILKWSNNQGEIIPKLSDDFVMLMVWNTLYVLYIGILAHSWLLHMIV